MSGYTEFIVWYFRQPKGDTVTAKFQRYEQSKPINPQEVNNAILDKFKKDSDIFLAVVLEWDNETGYYHHFSTIPNY